MARLQSPDGRWVVEVVTRTAAPDPSVPREPGRQSGGDGDTLRITRDGFYYCDVNTPDKLQEVIGDEQFALLQWVPA